MSGQYGCHVAVQGLDLNDYLYKEVWLTVDQFPDPPHTIQDVSVTHC